MTKNALPRPHAPKKAKSSGPSKKPRNQNASPTFTFPNSPDGSQSFTSLIVSVRSATTLKGVLEVLDLTLERFGDLLSETPQLQRTQTHVSKPYASMLCAGKRSVSSRMLKAIEVVIGQQLSAIIGEPIGIRITRNSPWNFALGKICEQHGAYEIDGRRKKCPRC